jgi:translocation and assembly module TamB
LPDLAPLAAAGGTQLSGRTALFLKATMQGQTTTADVDGTIKITGGMAPVPALLGEDAKLSVAVAMQGSDIDVKHLDLHGKTLDVSAKGTVANQVLNVDWRVALAELAVVAPSVSGKLEANGHVAGPQTDLALDADMKGDVAAPGIPPGPVHATLHAKGLPTAPSGQLTADGTLLGAPLTLALAADRAADGSMHLGIDKADWKSAHAEGAFALATGATLPTGKLSLAMSRLDDLRPLVGKPLTGSITANAETTEHEAKLNLEAQKAGLPGTASIGRATLTATVQEPTTKPVVDARLNVEGAQQGAMLANARLEVKGPEDALAMHLTANARNVAGSNADLTSAAVINATAKDTTVSSLEAVWKGQTVRLLGPARIGFADGVTVDRLRLGLQRAVLEVAGRASPTLDLTVALRDVTPQLAAAFMPGVSADGNLRADAKLTGSTAKPNGNIRVEAKGLHMRTGPGAALPAANLTAAVDLAAGEARVDTRLSAGSATNLKLTGSAPVSAGAGALDLHLDGTIDLAMLDPITMANGERVRGIITTRLGITGTTSAPRLGGTVQLARGEVQDFAQGAHLTDINATINAEGDTIRIARLNARAAPGTMSVSGTIGALAPGMPIDLVIKANNARPLASDRLTVNLNIDLAVRGRVSEQILAAGTIHMNRADIGIPETMPVSVAVLNVRRQGQPPPPPPKPGPAIALNLTVEAPRNIWVRGRGLDAELGGTIHVHGTSIKPEPDGSFELVRGTLSLAGTSLNFSKGEVSFNGGSLADPSLDFVATSTNGSMTANLEISGTASKPKITLSSTPELPQDQVLAQLLFGKPLSSLSPFEIAEIAAALAQLSGVTGGGGADPLAQIRKSFGLQELSVGSSSSGGAALQGGKYVAPGVFVGAKQGTSTNSTQGLVQVDLYKGLKLEGTVGTGTNQTPGASPEESAGSSVGLKYQFNY